MKLPEVDTDAVLRDVIRRVSFKSTLTKDFTISQPLAPGDPGTSVTPGPDYKSQIMRFVKPVVILEHPYGKLTWAPYGVPQKTYYRWVQLGAVAIGALAAYGIWSLAFADRHTR